MSKLYEGADPVSRAMTTPDLPGQIRFERVTGTIGALVHGVELGGTEPATSVESLRRALHEFGVLFFEFDHLVNALNSWRSPRSSVSPRRATA